MVKKKKTLIMTAYVSQCCDSGFKEIPRKLLPKKRIEMSFKCNQCFKPCKIIPFVKPTVKNRMDTLIRDITRAGFMSKSEARRRMGEILIIQKYDLVNKFDKMIGEDWPNPHDKYNKGSNDT